MTTSNRVAELESRLSRYKRLVESLFQPQPAEKQYEILEIIGAGGYGDVKKARHKDSGEIVALKGIPFDPQSRFNSMVIQEVNNVMSLKADSNIVTYRDIFRDDHDRLNYVMEYCDFDLEVFMRNPKNRSLKNLFSIAHQTARGTYVLHSSSPPIIHRDIKPANILLQINPQSGDVSVKLCDFSISTMATTTVGATTTFSVETMRDNLTNSLLTLETIAGHGTRPYMAPELLVASGKDGKFVFDASVDIFSLGLVIAYIFCYNTSSYGKICYVWHNNFH